MKRILGVVALLAALGPVGCGVPVAPEPWSVPVPADVPQIVLSAVSEAERRGHVLEVVEERVLGARSEPPLLFGSAPPRVAPGSEGRLAILDRANRRVFVVGADGEILAELGRPGQGPGEIGQAIDLLVFDDVIHVEDVVNRRWNRWSLDGELLDSVRLEVTGSEAAGVGDGRVVWRQTVRRSEGRDVMIALVDSTGRELREFVRAPWPERTIDPPLGEYPATESDAWWVGKVPPAHAVAPDGTVYFSVHERYQVHAFDPDGSARWALQRPADPQPLTRAEIDYHMALHARRFPDRTRAQVDWPDNEYALAQLAVDGHGHLYVFPYVARGTGPTEPRPVDVYSSDGEPLFSGTMSSSMFSTAFASYNGPMLDVAWQAAEGDRVWGVKTDPTSGEFQVVRYRLVEEF